MNDQQRTFLTKLLTTAAPSGFEEPASHVWREEARSFADDVTWDNVGNSMAWLRRGGDAAPTVVVEGHIDEIGFIVTYVDDEGFLWFDQIGGWDPQVVVGQRIEVLGSSGSVRGVIGRKAPHLMKPADRERVAELKELWIDIGASNREAAEQRVSVGDPAVIDVAPTEITDDLWVSRSMDNRTGAFVALETLRLLKDRDVRVNVCAVAAAREETAFAGAFNLAHQLRPLVAIALDVTHATDYPGANKHTDGDVKLGGGPVLGRGASVTPKVFDGLRSAAAELDISAPVQAAGRASGTDADAIARSGADIATGLVSVPNRYMHSPGEMVSLQDLENAARVIAEFVSTITGDSDFRP